MTRFEIYKDRTGEYRFRLVATNGKIIAVGEGYKSKRGCLIGVRSVMKNAPKAKVEDKTAPRPSRPAPKTRTKRKRPKKKAPPRKEAVLEKTVGFLKAGGPRAF